jgi:hypothetical protein
MAKVVYLIGSLKNRAIIELANKIRSLDFDCFDDWIGPGEEADDKFDEYRKGRGLNYKDALNSYAAQHIFKFDKTHLDRADIVILVMPAGKSGHLELGYSVGKGKTGYILMDGEPARVDIMHSFADEIFMTEQDLLNKLTSWDIRRTNKQAMVDAYLEHLTNPPKFYRNDHGC